MNYILLLQKVNELIYGWPIMLFIIVISCLFMIALRAIQVRYFCRAFKTIIYPSSSNTLTTTISPFHAFINTVNSNLGNAIIAGIATAIYAGGPGALFWFVCFGIVLMAVRFIEVYASTWYASREKEKSTMFSGPMLYLQFVPGGSFLPYLYALFCVFYGLIGGNLIQANSMAVSLAATWGISSLYTGVILCLFVIYIFFGGAEQVKRISMNMVPLKVAVFIVATMVILLFHYKFLGAAICLIIKSAFNPQALHGGIIGFSFQHMIAAGISRSIIATESGLGSAAILFGSTGNNDAMQNGLMGMVSTFVSISIGFIVGLCIVVSQVYNSGLNSTALTVAAFDTVFGMYGGWIVSFLSVSFGCGVMVSYAYVVQSAWKVLASDRYKLVLILLYSACALMGAVATVDVVWYLADIILFLMLAINLYGLLMLLPQLRRSIFNEL